MSDYCFQGTCIAIILALAPRYVHTDFRKGGLCAKSAPPRPTAHVVLEYYAAATLLHVTAQVAEVVILVD